MSLCPMCQERPVATKTTGGRPPVTCGRAACRAARRRLSRRASHAAQNAQRKADRLADTRYVCTCGQTYTPVTRHQRYCSRACFFEARREAWATRDLLRATVTDQIEAQFQAARSARLAEERATGRRRYTIETGWIQRPGAGVYNDGDEQGWGFA